MGYRYAFLNGAHFCFAEQYFLVVMGVLSFSAWLGYVMNNLCLTYILGKHCKNN
jgi:hypothetical protein